MKYSSVMLALVACCVGSAAWANKGTAWTAKGGGLMSDPKNWSAGAPDAGAGDLVWISGCEQAAVITNDIPGLRLSKIENDTTYPVTIVGENELEFSIYSDCAYALLGDVTFDVPVRLTTAGGLTSGSLHVGTGRTMTFNGPVSVTNATDVGAPVALVLSNESSSDGRFVFNDVIYGPTADVQNKGQPQLICQESVVLNSLTWGVFWTAATAHFYGTGNRIGTLYPGVEVGTTMFFHAADALSEGTVLGFCDAGYLNTPGFTWTGGVYDFAGDQTFDRVLSGGVTDVGGKTHDIDRVQGSGTLTMRARDNGASHAAWNGAVSLVYDPLSDDYTYECLGRANAMTGTLKVKGGTLRIAEGATFLSVPSVTLEGNARLSVDSPMASPFAAGVRFALSRSAQLVLTEDTALTVDQLLRDGLFVAKGVYTGVGHGQEGSVREVAWIDGAGTVTVTDDVTCWKNASSGAWDNPDMWTDGLPAAGRRAAFMVSGGDYTVSIPDGMTMPQGLILKNEGAGRVTLTGDMTFEKAWIEVGPGGCIEVPAGKSFVYSGKDSLGNRTVPESAQCTAATSPIHIHDGGELLVSGGYAVITNLAGYALLDGTPDSPGVINVTAGSFGVFAVNVSSDRLMVADGGRLVFEDGAVCTCGEDPRVFAGSGDGKVAFETGSVCLPNLSSYLAAKGQVTFDLSSNLFSPSLYGAIFGWDLESEDRATFNLENIRLVTGGGGVCVSAPRNGYVYRTSDIDVTVNARSGTSLYSGGTHTGEYIAEGTLVAYAAQSYYYSEPKISGTLNLETGSSLTNAYGHFVVGAGYGKGAVNVSGGEIVSGLTSASGDGTARQFVLGTWGGTGALKMTAGRLSVASDAYVGGAVTNVFPESARWGWVDPSLPRSPVFERHDAQGTLDLAGGDAVFAKRLIVGSDGSGEIVRRGKAGSFTAGEIVFSNSVENASSGGTARFVLDEHGVVPFKAKGKLSIGNNARLVVDASAYPADGRSVTLFRCGALEGRFAAVELTGEFCKKATLVYGPNSVRLAVPTGLVITVR